MKNLVKILRQQIAELKNLLALKDQRIRELEAQQRPSITWPYQPINVPFIAQDLCTDGGMHFYPSPWLGTIPPACQKCGKQQFGSTISVGHTSTFIPGLEPIKCDIDFGKKN